jgi:glutathione S-transferase
MHSGFTTLRQVLVCNLSTEFPGLGEQKIAENEALKVDVQRIFSIFEDALKQSGGPFLFGEYSIGEYHASQQQQIMH